MSPDEPLFLDAEDVIEIYANQLEIFGGSAGLRDRGLLDAAVAQPRASFGGQFLHQGPFEMGAAYLFHIVRNHPFVDGNERTGFLAALVFVDLVFVDLNGITIDRPTRSTS